MVLARESLRAIVADGLPGVAGSKGSLEIAANDADDCAVKLGAYIYSLGG